MTALLLAAVLATPGSFKDGSYKEEVEKFRASLDAELREDEGWLTLAGLTWLQPGENTIGSGDDCAVKLPSGHAPGRVGILILKDDGSVEFQPATEKITQTIKPEETKVHSRDVVWKIIVRGKRTGVRFYDMKSEARASFKGRNWFPVSEELDLKAKFTPFGTPKKVPITNVLGDVSLEEASGTVEFAVNGKTYHLTALKFGDGFFFNFRDATSGKQTYAAGRFLYTGGPVNGIVDLDFNKAMNPPCAFTDFATCPLPPHENVLPVPVEAGEKVFRHH